MKIKPLPAISELRRCLAYDETIGGLIWIERPSAHSPVKVGAPAAYPDSKYKRLSFKNIRYLEHRVIWAVVHGYDPLLYVDHANGDTLDNRPQNLREATNGENRANSCISKNNTSGFKGVTYYKRHAKWTAQLRVNGRQIPLGYFDSPEDAHMAYCEAASKHFGEFARAG